MQVNRTETRYIQLADDRQVAYCEYGDPNGKPVFYFHGTPGSRYEPQFGTQAARDYGYRILALDRPGIGRSDYVRGRTLLDWPKDVKTIAEQLEITQFGVIGVSGGGPYALACGFALPEQLEFTVLMGSWGPVAEEPKLWLEMAPLDRFFGKIAKRAPWAFYMPFSYIGYASRRLSPQGFIKLLSSSMSAADKELMADAEMARFFALDVREAFQQGVLGPADDALLLYGTWGFRIEEVTVNVEVYHGKEDQFAPFSYAEYLNARLPHSTLHAYPKQGHLFVMRLFGEVFEQISQ